MGYAEHLVETVYITQWAAPGGIETTRATINGKWAHPAGGSIYTTSWGKPHWHRTKVEAVAQAEAVRIKKIASLEKRLVRLKALRFRVEDIKDPE